MQRSLRLVGQLVTLCVAYVFATAHCAPFAYVINYNAQRLAVIDTANNAVTASVPIGYGAEGVAISPNGKRVYVTNTGDNSLSVIDAQSNALISTLPVGLRPFGVTVSQDSTKVYVANAWDNEVAVVNAITNSVQSRVPVGAFPWGIAVSPDGGRLYVANSDSDTISVIATSTNIVLFTIRVGRQPIAIAFSPDGSRVFVTNSKSNTVSVISTTTNSVISTIAVGAYPSAVSVTPNGGRVFVANANSNNVSVIDANNGSVVSAVAVGDGPNGVSVTPDGTRVYVINFNNYSLSVISTATLAVTTLRTSWPFSTGLGQFIGPSATAGPADLTADMIEFYHPQLDYYFMTSRGNEIAALDATPAFRRTGLVFRVYPSMGSATTDFGSRMPITRYYFDKIAVNATRGSHFYTLVPSETAALNALNPVNAQIPRLPYNEGVDSYAYLPVLEGVGGRCAAGLIPVYRLFRGNVAFPDNPNHRFTSSLATYNSFVALGWNGEGVKFCVPN